MIFIVYVSNTSQSMSRYSTFQMMLQELNEMNTKVETALADNRNWFVFGPIICRKFLNQAHSFMLILQKNLSSNSTDIDNQSFDVSSIWALIRVLFETHATYFHLFMPCNNIEENILRFRLWELDSIKSLIRFRRQHIEAEISEMIEWLSRSEERCRNAIHSLGYFNGLDERTKDFLLDRCCWRFSSESLLRSNKRLSYNELIKNTGIDEAHFFDFYEYTSMHVHASYGGVRQNAGLSKRNIEEMLHVAIMQGCFVSAFFIHDLKERYVEAGEHFSKMSELNIRVIDSFVRQGRT